MKKEISEKQKQMYKWVGRGIAAAINSTLLLIMMMNIHWSASFFISILVINRMIKGWADQDNAERADREMEAVLKRMAGHAPTDFDNRRPFLCEVKVTKSSESKDESNTNTFEKLKDEVDKLK